MSHILKLDNIGLTYPRQGQPSVHDISLTLNQGEIVSLVGESGSGKSTLLKIIAGFAKPQQGKLYLKGACISDKTCHVRPEKRGIGFVSQGGGLFPHMNIIDNISYGLKKHKKTEQVQISLDLLDAVELKGAAYKFPHELSGGEQQRVALIRALAPKPSLILLDEPFSSLDERLRKELLNVTFDLLRKQKATALFVTHHTQDALKVSDKIGVLQDGNCVQFGTPHTLWHHPNSLKIANLFTDNNDYSRLPKPIKEQHQIPDWGKIADVKLSAISNEQDSTSKQHLTARIIKKEFVGNSYIVTLEELQSLTPIKAVVEIEDLAKLDKPDQIVQLSLSPTA